MKSSSLPLLHRFQTIASKIILDFPSSHEGREDSLINRIIYINLMSYKKTASTKTEHTIKTLIGGMMLVSKAEDAGDIIEPLLSAEGRLPNSPPREPSTCDVLNEIFLRNWRVSEASGRQTQMSVVEVTCFLLNVL